MGPWQSIIDTLQGILVACGGLGIVVALAIKAAAGHDASKHAFSHVLIGGAVSGLLIGLLAKDIYQLMLSWI